MAIFGNIQVCIFSGNNQSTPKISDASDCFWLFWPFKWLHGPRWSRLSFKRPFYIGNHYCFTKICPKFDIWGWRLSRWPILGHFLPFSAISGHVHGPRWSRLCFNRPFFSENQCCFNNICPKIDIWGWSWSRWPILDHFRPFPAISGHAHGPRWSRISFKHLFFSGNQCCFNNICPKIYIWGCRCSR